jgi:hypothetical protein
MENSLSNRLLLAHPLKQYATTAEYEEQNSNGYQEEQSTHANDLVLQDNHECDSFLRCSRFAFIPFVPVFPAP